MNRQYLERNEIKRIEKISKFKFEECDKENTKKSRQERG